MQLQGFHESGVESTLRGAVHTSVSLEITAFDKFLIAAVPAPRAASQQSRSGGGGGVLATQEAEPFATPQNVTFSVRELKHLLAFVQSSSVDGQELAMFFSSPGDPVLFSTQGVQKRSFHAMLIVASLEQPVQPAPGSPLAASLAKLQQQRQR